jgi:hypothetical protein
LKQKIEGNGADPRVDGIDRQAASIDGDRIAQSKFLRERHGHGKAGLFATRFDGADGSKSFDESGEHGE